MVRPAVSFLTLAVLLVAAPTQADSFSAMPMVQRADELLTQALPSPVIERNDALIMRALPNVLQYGSLEERSIPVTSQMHHTVTLAAYTVHCNHRLDVRAGAGLAEIIDAPASLDMPRSGPAFGGGVNYEVAEVKGLRVALDFSALHVSYGNVGMTDETLLIAVSTR